MINLLGFWLEELWSISVLLQMYTLQSQSTALPRVELTSKCIDMDMRYSFFNVGKCLYVVEYITSFVTFMMDDIISRLLASMALVCWYLELYFELSQLYCHNCPLCEGEIIKNEIAFSSKSSDIAR